jgi:hypothetical protein
MNDWRHFPAEDPGHCPMTLAVIETVGHVGVNRRAAPELDPSNIVGSWDDGTLLMVWACVPAEVPPGHWLLCQAVEGDVQATSRLLM